MKPAKRRRYAVRDLGLDQATVDAVAREAVAHPHSVVSELRFQALGEGRSVRGAVGHRIRAALALRGLPPGRPS